MMLRTQVLVFAAVGAAASLLVGGVGLWSSDRQSRTVEQLQLASATVRDSMDGDMMHDAIRSDVLAALVAARDRSAAGIAEAGKALDEHRTRYNRALDSLAAARMSDAARQQLGRTVPIVRSYLATSAAALDAAAANAAALEALMPAFEHDFDVLEAEMEKLGDAIERDSDALREQARETAGHTRWLIAGALALALGTLSVAAGVLTRRAVGPIHRAMVVADRIAEGDLGVEVALQGTGEAATLMRSLERMRRALVSLSTKVLAHSREVTASAVEVSGGSTRLAQRNRDDVTELERSKAALDRVGDEIEHSLAETREVGSLAVRSAAAAARGGEVVAQVVQTMGGISESSRRIADIIGVIDGIAFQTNILALNAAVEAARAGEQGRGFAVVATEVRALAQRSAGAAREIKQLIGDSVSRVETGTQWVDQAGTTMREIVDSIQRVSALIGEIDAATQRQAAGIVDVRAAFEHLGASMHANAGLMQQTARAGEAMSGQARELLAAASAFKVPAGAAPVPESRAVTRADGCALVSAVA